MKGLVLAIGAYDAVLWRTLIAGVGCRRSYLRGGSAGPRPSARGFRLHVRAACVRR